MRSDSREMRQQERQQQTTGSGTTLTRVARVTELGGSRKSETRRGRREGEGAGQGST